MIFFGGFGVDAKILVSSLVSSDDVVVVIFSSAAVHVSD